MTSRMIPKTANTLETIQQSIASELRSLNERILLSLSSPNRMMNNIVEEYLRRKGKQIRPIMVIPLSWFTLFSDSLPTSMPPRIKAIFRIACASRVFFR